MVEANGYTATRLGSTRPGIPVSHTTFGRSAAVVGYVVDETGATPSTGRSDVASMSGGRAGDSGRLHGDRGRSADGIGDRGSSGSVPANRSPALNDFTPLFKDRPVIRTTCKIATVARHPTGHKSRGWLETRIRELETEVAMLRGAQHRGGWASG